MGTAVATAAVSATQRSGTICTEALEAVLPARGLFTISRAMGGVASAAVQMIKRISEQTCHRWSNELVILPKDYQKIFPHEILLNVSWIHDNEICSWCEQRFAPSILGERWYRLTIGDLRYDPIKVLYGFSNAEDAALFKLTWC